MDRDKIIRMAREAGFRSGHITLNSGEPLPFVAPVSATSCIVELERFAAIVAAAEREACAKICTSEGVTYDECMAGQMFAREIRALNKTGKGHES